MVVTASRLSAVKYKLAFDKYIKDKGYSEALLLPLAGCVGIGVERCSTLATGN
jgi:type I restriction enzyme R subunit